MKKVKQLQQPRWMLLALAVVSIALVGSTVWRISGITKGKAIPTDPKQKFYERLRRGVGSEVRFATASDSPEQVNASVESIAEFIHQRANLRMNDDTKRKLAKAEQNALTGKSRRISVEELPDLFAGIIVKRFANLTDEEISKAANTYHATPESQISSRGTGKWGFLSKEEFIKQAKSARESSQRNDSTLNATLHSLAQEEVKDRTAYLSEALPKQFGGINTEGVTPLQALLIAYSVASDDPLSDSQDDMKQMIIRQRMDDKRKKYDKRYSGKGFGVDGEFFSSNENENFAASHALYDMYGYKLPRRWL